MTHWIVGAALSLILGVLISFGNYRISVRMFDKNPALLQVTTLSRQLLNIGYLAAVYFIAPHTPWDRVPLLVAAVIGVTGGLFYFTYRLVKHMDKQKAAKESSGSVSSPKDADSNIQ